jgi:autotransporter-associated beta strand protein
VGAATKIITGGKLTSEFEVGPADQAYYGVTAETFNQNDLIVHNYAPAATFRIASIIEDNALTTGNSGRAFPVNFIHTGDGTTRLAAANTYTGFTFANSGTILLESSGALPGGIGATGGLSNLRFDGGVLGLGVDGVFSRGLGNGQAAVQWVGSGGFAAFGGSAGSN